MVRTFVDACVLIEAHCGERPRRERALALLRNPKRLFVSSPFLYLETVPMAVFFGRQSEVKHYQEYFETLVRISVEDVAAIVRLARNEAERCDMGAVDALHVAAAHLAQADELVSLEKTSKPLYRSSLVRVVHLDAAE